jgi:tape measure domain-containing protein
MTRYDGAVIINTQLKSDEYNRALKQLETSTNKTITELETHTTQSLQKVSNLSQDTFLSLKNIAAGLGLSMTGREISNLASEMTNLYARAEIAAKGMYDTSDMMDRLRSIADRAYSPLKSTAEAFMNNAFALNDLGMSMERQLDLADSLTNALVVSGAKGQDFELVMNAVNRSIAVGSMAGRELEMVMKYGGAAAEGMAAHLNTSLVGLKEMARQGQLTSDVVANSLIANMEKWRQQADLMPATIEDAFVRLHNQLLITINDINEATGFEQKIVKGIDYVKDHLDDIVDIIPTAVAGFAALKVARSDYMGIVTKGIGDFVKSSKSIISEFSALSKSNNVINSVKIAFSGLDEGVASNISTFELLKSKVTGNTDAILDAYEAAIKNAHASAENAKSNLDMANSAKEAAQQEINLLEAAEESSEKAEKLNEAYATLTQKMDEVVGAEAQYEAETMRATQLEEQHARISGASALQIAKNKQAEALAAKTATHAEIVETEARIANLRASQSQYAQTVLRQQEERKLLVLRQQAIAQEKAYALAVAQTAAAQKAATITGRALSMLKAAGVGIMSLFGGPLGLALTAATVGTMYFMSRESEADRITKEYSKSIEALSEKYQALKTYATEAGEAIIIAGKSDIDDQIKKAENDLFDLRQSIISSQFRGLSEFDLYKNYDSYNPYEKQGIDRLDLIETYTKEFKEDLKEIMRLAEEGSYAAIEKIQAFEINYEEEIKELKDLRDFFKKMTGYTKGDEFIPGLIQQMEGVQDHLNKLRNSAKEYKELLTNPIEKKSAISLMLERDISYMHTVKKELTDLSYDLSNVNIIDLDKQIKTLEDAEKSYQEYNADLLKQARENHKLMQDEYNKLIEEGEGADQELLKKAENRLKELSEYIIDLEKNTIKGQQYLRDKFFTDFAVQNEEKIKGHKLEAEEELKIREKVLKERILLESEGEEAQKNASIRSLSQIKDMTDSAIALYKNLENAGIASAQGMVNTLTQQKSILENLILKLMEYTKRTEALDTGLGPGPKETPISSPKSGGGGGETAEERAKKTAEALQEVKLQLAQLENDKITVMEIENLQEIQQFTELLQEAGIKGREATEYIDRFNQARAEQVKLDNLNEQLTFFDQLKGKLPGAIEEYNKLNAEITALQAEMYRGLGIPETYVRAFLDITELNEAQDFWSGLRRGVRDYSQSLSDAEIAQDFANSSMDILSETLLGLVQGTVSAKEAFSNMALSIVASLQKMAIEMLVVQPIMQALMSLMGGFFGGGLAAPIGSFGLAHSGGIVGVPGAQKKVPESVFFGAPRYHTGGITGLRYNEVPIIAQKGEMILTRADQSALLSMLRNSPGGGDGTQINVQIINQTSQEVESQTSASRNSNGGIDLEVILRQVDSDLAKKQNNGTSALGKSFKTIYQLNDAQSLYRRG